MSYLNLVDLAGSEQDQTIMLMFDMLDLPLSFLYGAITSLVSYTVLYLTSVILLRLGLYPGLNPPPPNQHLKIHSYITSLVHAIAQTLACWYPAIHSTAHWNNRVMHSDDRLYVEYGVTGLGPTFWSGVFVGYLLTDLLAVGWYEKPLMICHHVFASVAWTYTVSTGSLQWYHCFLQLNELSTIFLSIRPVLISGFGYGKASKQVMALNGCTFFSFCLIRVVPLPIVLYKYWSTDRHTLQNHAGDATLYMITVLLLFHTVMQCFWFNGMVNIARSVLSGSGKDPNVKKKAS